MTDDVCLKISHEILKAIGNVEKTNGITLIKNYKNNKKLTLLWMQEELEGVLSRLAVHSSGDFAKIPHTLLPDACRRLATVIDEIISLQEGIDEM